MADVTDFIVLDVHPCRETSLVARGLTPDFGRMTFMFRDARKIGAGTVPVDKYMELEVEFDADDESEIVTPRRHEQIGGFAAIADDTRCYAMAGRIGAFLLANCPVQDAQPFTFDVLKSVFTNLSMGSSAPWSLVECSVLVKLTFLTENGMMPGVSPEQGEFLDSVISSGIDGSQLPCQDPQYWNAINHWLNDVMECHGVRR